MGAREQDRVETTGRAAVEARLRGRRHSKVRDQEAIAHHYDVSNRFYEWVLGPSMAYTCAVYPHEGATLEEAFLHLTGGTAAPDPEATEAASARREIVDHDQPAIDTAVISHSVRHDDAVIDHPPHRHAPMLRSLSRAAASFWSATTARIRISMISGEKDSDSSPSAIILAEPSRENTEPK